MTARPLRVLLVEDNPSDAEFVLWELRRAGYEPLAQRVESEAAFVVALTPELDVVLADYALPGFDGRLRAFRAFKPEADATKPTGWRFVQDGTRLWPDIDGRPELAGEARPPSTASASLVSVLIRPSRSR